MEQKLVRSIIKVGNSAGVLLPKRWLNGEARVELISKPLNIKKDIFEILDQYLNDIQGIYLIGSYARGEYTERSDIDILAITNKENKKIKKGRYNIILISQNNMEERLKEDILPLLPMLREAKSLLNMPLIKEYKRTPLTKKNLKWHIETTKSVMQVNKRFIEISEIQNEKVSDDVIYSLILRLREIYIINCLIKNKKPTTKGILDLIMQITKSKDSYEAYLRSKDNKPEREKISVQEANKLYNYIKKEIKQQERWLAKRD